MKDRKKVGGRQKKEIKPKKNSKSQKIVKVNSQIAFLNCILYLQNHFLSSP